MTYASMAVRDVQYAMFNLDYTPERLLKEGCPKAPAGPEPDPCIRRLKAVLTHPIGDYAVQPRDATMVSAFPIRKSIPWPRDLISMVSLSSESFCRRRMVSPCHII
jgi:hypothetical protein